LMTSRSICPYRYVDFYVVNRCVDIPLFLPDPQIKTIFFLQQMDISQS
jgi:hypothetical protein